MLPSGSLDVKLVDTANEVVKEELQDPNIAEGTFVDKMLPSDAFEEISSLMERRWWWWRRLDGTMVKRGWSFALSTREASSLLQTYMQKSIFIQLINPKKYCEGKFLEKIQGAQVQLRKTTKLLMHVFHLSKTRLLGIQNMPKHQWKRSLKLLKPPTQKGSPQVKVNFGTSL
ncbi:hypothetical protein Tco_0374943 [Tanacetum coccineum]